MARSLLVRDLGRTRYAPVYAAMQEYNLSRKPDAPDYIWLTEHDPVFTQGRAGRAEHLLMPGDIAVVQTDRGGQVTYHGPGQLVAYVLLDLRRYGLGPKALVGLIERSVVTLLSEYGIDAAGRPDAPGVYVDGAKIASLGLRISRGCSYHGLALNVDMDLEPFSRINPCGLQGMQVVQVTSWQPQVALADLKVPLVNQIAAELGTDWRWETDAMAQFG